MGTLRHSDVLLGEERLSSHVNGNTWYQSQVQVLRLRFQTSRDPTVQSGIVHNIMSDVWVANGRFLEYHETDGVISMLANNKAFELIQKELRKKVPAKEQSLKEFSSRRRRAASSSSDKKSKTTTMGKGSSSKKTAKKAFSKAKKTKSKSEKTKKKNDTKSKNRKKRSDAKKKKFVMAS